MQHSLTALLKPDGWTLTHNPGNGDNSNYGSHCVREWVPLPLPGSLGRHERAAALTVGPHYDVIAFQFGLHDIAYDEERVSVL